MGEKLMITWMSERPKKGNPTRFPLGTPIYAHVIAILAMLGFLLIFEVANNGYYLEYTSWQSSFLIFALISLVVVAIAAIAFYSIQVTMKYRQIVEAMSESEERYRSLFAQVPLGLYRTTPDGQILDANPALVEMLGYPDRESLLAVSASELFVNPEDRLRENALVDQYGIVKYIEIQLYRYDQTQIWVRDTVRSVKDEAGRVLYYDGSLEDINEKKRMEQSFLRSERLAAMGKVMATLCHEIKNPLQAIMSNLELVLGFQLEPDEREENLRSCYQEVERLIEITNRMLLFSRAEPTAVQPVSIPQVWQQTFDFLSKTLHQSKIQVMVEFPEDLPLVLGSADQIRQVFLNLLLNSIEAMPTGGSIHLSAAHEGQMVVLHLRNSGPTIPTEHLEHIFEPFYTTKAIGTGLGLFISHNLIHQHGGSLSADNLENGSGVIFTITLPVAPNVSREEPGV